MRIEGAASSKLRVNYSVDATIQFDVKRDIKPQNRFAK